MNSVTGVGGGAVASTGFALAVSTGAVFSLNSATAAAFALDPSRGGALLFRTVPQCSSSAVGCGSANLGGTWINNTADEGGAIAALFDNGVTDPNTLFIGASIQASGNSAVHGGVLYLQNWPNVTTSPPGMKPPRPPQGSTAAAAISARWIVWSSSKNVWSTGSSWAAAVGANSSVTTAGITGGSLQGMVNNSASVGAVLFGRQCAIEGAPCTVFPYDPGDSLGPGRLLPCPGIASGARSLVSYPVAPNQCSSHGPVVGTAPAYFTISLSGSVSSLNNGSDVPLNPYSLLASSPNVRSAIGSALNPLLAMSSGPNLDGSTVASLSNWDPAFRPPTVAVFDWLNQLVTSGTMMSSAGSAAGATSSSNASMSFQVSSSELSLFGRTVELYMTQAAEAAISQLPPPGALVNPSKATVGRRQLMATSPPPQTAAPPAPPKSALSPPLPPLSTMPPLAAATILPPPNPPPTRQPPAPPQTPNNMSPQTVSYTSVSAVSEFTTLAVGPPLGATSAVSAGTLLFSSAGDPSFYGSAWGTTQNLSIQVTACGQGMSFSPAVRSCACVAGAVPSTIVKSACSCQHGSFLTPSSAVSRNETFTLSPGAAPNWNCASCPANTLCPGSGDNYAYVEPGYWRASIFDSVVHQCPASFCLGQTLQSLGKDATILTPAFWSLNPDSESYSAPRYLPPPIKCRKGHSGPLCAVCIPEYTFRSGVCELCAPGSAFKDIPSGARIVFFFFCTLILLVLVLVISSALHPKFDEVVFRVVEVAADAKKTAAAADHHLKVSLLHNLGNLLKPGDEENTAGTETMRGRMYNAVLESTEADEDAGAAGGGRRDTEAAEKDAGISPAKAIQVELKSVFLESLRRGAEAVGVRKRVESAHDELPAEDEPHIAGGQQPKIDDVADSLGLRIKLAVVNIFAILHAWLAGAAATTDNRAQKDASAENLTSPRRVGGADGAKQNAKSDMETGTRPAGSPIIGVSDSVATRTSGFGAMAKTMLSTGQIILSFKKNLAVPWPPLYTSTVRLLESWCVRSANSRAALLAASAGSATTTGGFDLLFQFQSTTLITSACRFNVDLVALPVIACWFPGLGFYQRLNATCLGISGSCIAMGLLYRIGMRFNRKVLFEADKEDIILEKAAAFDDMELREDREAEDHGGARVREAHKKSQAYKDVQHQVLKWCDGGRFETAALAVKRSYRFRRFQTRIITLFLFVLYLTYPNVSSIVIQTAGCDWLTDVAVPPVLVWTYKGCFATVSATGVVIPVPPLSLNFQNGSLERCQATALHGNLTMIAIAPPDAADAVFPYTCSRCSAMQTGVYGAVPTSPPAELGALAATTLGLAGNFTRVICSGGEFSSTPTTALLLPDSACRPPLPPGATKQTAGPTAVTVGKSWAVPGAQRVFAYEPSAQTYDYKAAGTTGPVVQLSSMPYLLRADYRVVCYDTHWYFYRSLCWFWAAVFPIGIPLLFSYLLHVNDIQWLSLRRQQTAWLQIAAKAAWRKTLAKVAVAKASAAKLAAERGLAGRPVDDSAVLNEEDKRALEWMGATEGLSICTMSEERAAGLLKLLKRSEERNPYGEEDPVPLSFDELVAQHKLKPASDGAAQGAAIAAAPAEAGGSGTRTTIVAVEAEGGPALHTAGGPLHSRPEGAAAHERTRRWNEEVPNLRARCLDAFKATAARAHGHAMNTVSERPVLVSGVKLTLLLLLLLLQLIPIGLLSVLAAVESAMNRFVAAPLKTAFIAVQQSVVYLSRRGAAAVKSATSDAWQAALTSFEEDASCPPQYTTFAKVVIGGYTKDSFDNDLVKKHFVDAILQLVGSVPAQSIHGVRDLASEDALHAVVNIKNVTSARHIASLPVSVAFSVSGNKPTVALLRGEIATNGLALLQQHGLTEAVSLSLVGLSARGAAQTDVSWCETFDFRHAEALKLVSFVQNDSKEKLRIPLLRWRTELESEHELHETIRRLKAAVIEMNGPNASNGFLSSVFVIIEGSSVRAPTDAEWDAHNHEEEIENATYGGTVSQREYDTRRLRRLQRLWGESEVVSAPAAAETTADVTSAVAASATAQAGRASHDGDPVDASAVPAVHRVEESTRQRSSKLTVVLRFMQRVFRALCWTCNLVTGRTPPRSSSQRGGNWVDFRSFDAALHELIFSQRCAPVLQ